jgi:ribosomal protein S18 acetylase RimI-like enzyme
MQVTPLTSENQAAALAYLRAMPYRNALPLSNATQLRTACDVLVAQEHGRIFGVASTYHDLPIANLTFAAESSAIVGALITALAERNTRLREGIVWSLLPSDRAVQLAQHVQLVAAETEYQMVVEPEQLKVSLRHAPRRLIEADVPQMNVLAVTAGLEVWHQSALALGPAFGCFEGTQLVAMAATHFITPEVIEIGHVATHPAFRRRGYAAACTSALTQAAFALAPRVFLMVLEHNTAALAAYKQLGFRVLDRMRMAQFRL